MGGRDRLGVPFGKYQLLRRLGRGGMAEVWEAEINGPAGFARTLVVKRILPHLAADPRFVEMFCAEARLSARLSHANIVQVFEFGEVDGEYFLAMELVRGCDLASLLQEARRIGPPPPGLGALVLREVCRALAYAHALRDDRGAPLGLVHRDVSPSNIMVSVDGAVKLLDFGIAKALGDHDHRTQTGVLKGKCGYLAPEQVESRGRDVDPRADLFAAGVVLHEALTGNRLFQRADLGETLALVREARVEPPSLVNPAAPPELDRICLRALARLPASRYQTADEMAADLDEVIHRLRFGPEQLAALQRELFPSHARTPDESTARPGTEPRAHGGSLASGELGSLPTASSATANSVPRRVGVRRRLVLATSAAGLITVTAALFALTRPDPVAPPPAPLPALAPSVSPLPLDTQVAVRVVSQPPAAEVTVLGESTPRGRTPLTLHLLRGEGATQLTVAARGYLPLPVRVRHHEDATVRLVLERAIPRSPRSPTAPPAPADEPDPPPAPPTGHNIRGGEVVDPFAR
ncbi:MAG: serine/threonine protein kinase [Myxococcales bacterium]|nr:serine/threonine protein kinase [Myxococcales bacterium]